MKTLNFEQMEKVEGGMPGWLRCGLGVVGGAITVGLGGAAAGSVVPALGTTAGAIVGAIGGAMTGAATFC